MLLWQVPPGLLAVAFPPADCQLPLPVNLLSLAAAALKEPASSSATEQQQQQQAAEQQVRLGEAGNRQSPGQQQPQQPQQFKTAMDSITGQPAWLVLSQLLLQLLQLAAQSVLLKTGAATAPLAAAAAAGVQEQAGVLAICCSAETAAARRAAAQGQTSGEQAAAPATAAYPGDELEARLLATLAQCCSGEIAAWCVTNRHVTFSGMAACDDNPLGIRMISACLVTAGSSSAPAVLECRAVPLAAACLSRLHSQLHDALFTPAVQLAYCLGSASTNCNSDSAKQLMFLEMVSRHMLVQLGQAMPSTLNINCACSCPGRAKCSRRWGEAAEVTERLEQRRSMHWSSSSSSRRWKVNGSRSSRSSSTLSSATEGLVHCGGAIAAANNADSGSEQLNPERVPHCCCCR